MIRRTKIVCTIGPATESEAMLERLIRAGMNVVRLNFSHGTQSQHAAVVHRLRAVSRRLNVPIAILQDLQGPKIRTGELGGGQPVELREGQPFTLTSRRVVGTEQVVSTTYAGLPTEVHPGSRLLLDDGLIELAVERVTGEEVVTRVVRGGRLKEHKGINLPGVVVGLPSLTEKDRADLAFGLSSGVDYVALSFVRRADDVVQVKRAMAEMDPVGVKPPVIAKLEKPSALENLPAILNVADGVMVARGDLGVELSPEEVPSAQKRIIQAANRERKIVITATQMLESMIVNPRPTRAEASDVANAIFDGTDALMLSGETAYGQYPAEAVQIMARIAEEAEAHLDEWGRWHGVLGDELTSDDATALARAARELAHDRDVSAIAVFTKSGRTARLMSKARPRVPILTFTPVETTFTRLGLLWGVTPYLVPETQSMEDMLAQVDSAIMLASPVRPGQQVVLIAGLPVAVQGPANMILIHTVGRGG